MHTSLFYLFASIALISATMVLIATNPIHSVIFLILVFCNATALLILLKIEFIAMMFLIIYVGAIAVLFLFVVMMLNIKLSEISENKWRYLPVGGVISMIFLFEILLAFDSDFIPLLDSTNFDSNYEPILQLTQLWDTYGTTTEQKSWASLIDGVLNSNIQTLGFLIYTYYFYYFLMASFILLIAMIGAIVLTMHKRIHAAKKQQIFKQVSRNFESAINYASTK